MHMNFKRFKKDGDDDHQDVSPQKPVPQPPEFNLNT